MLIRSVGRALRARRIAAASVSVRTFSSEKEGNAVKERFVSIDRSGLKQPHLHTLLKDNDHVKSLKKKAKENDLTRFLHTMIAARGPITVAEFMRHALSHPVHGYYMKRDVFGTKGDFTTAPEISQMFGELIGIWCIATWQQMGSPSHLKVVEMGPGRGSLMDDFVRTAKQFPAFYKAIELHLVEISPALRTIQQTKLNAKEKIDGWQLPNDGPSIFWHEDIAQVPDGPTIFIAQELFDALPVHQFEYTAKGWCERLIDIDETSESEDHFCFVLSPGPTPATRVYIGKEKIVAPDAQLLKNLPKHGSLQEFLDDMNTASIVTEKLEKESQETENVKPVLSPNVQVGDRIEVCPLGIGIIQDISKRISQHGGAALVVDYGRDHPSEVSLRGIQNHQFVSVLREPGDVDLSIDVDFSTLKRYAKESGDIRAYGPVGQGHFLKEMGIEHRMAALFQNAPEDVQETIYEAYERLVSPDQMGTIFKAMAIVSNKVQGEPVGFNPPKENELMLPKIGTSDVRPGHGPTITTGVSTPPARSNMFEYLQRSVAENPSGNFLGHRPKDANEVAGDYVWQTYEQVFNRVHHAASGLIYHDMIPPTTNSNERVLGIYMKNRPEWVIVQYAAMFCGGFAVALYDTLGADAIPYIMNQTQLSTVVCTKLELPKVVQAKELAPELKHVILCDVDVKPDVKLATQAGLTLWTLAELEASGMGRLIQPTIPSTVDVYCLIYTSGTTGEPKGVPLSHKNIVHAIEANRHRMCHGKATVIFGPLCVHLSYLPLAHSIEHLCEASVVVHGGKIAFYQGDTAKILDDLALVRPQFFGVVPRLLNKIYDKVVHGSDGTNKGWKAMMFRSALRTKLFLLRRGIRRHPVFDRLIFSTWLLDSKSLGLDRCCMMIVGSAPLADDVMDFFRVLFDFPAVEAYGLSELTGIATENLATQSVAGDVGLPLPGVEVKLVSVPEMGYDVRDIKHGTKNVIAVAGRGEVCFRGPQVFSGYYKRPDATAEAIDKDGWFHTGDVGVWLPDGRLKIVDRKKNIFKLSQGEYVAPERIENILTTSKYVEQVFVYGDSLHSMLVAVTIPQEAPMLTLAKELGIQGPFVKLCQDPMMKEAVHNNLIALCKKSKLFGFEIIKAIYLHPTPFSVENNMMTPTFKLKRHECKRQFIEEINKMYAACSDLVGGRNILRSIFAGIRDSASSTVIDADES